MTVKQYEAESMPDVLRLVRQDLGEAAVILETRRIRPGLMGRLGRREQVRVLAALDGSPAPRGPVRVPSGEARPTVGTQRAPAAGGVDVRRAARILRLTESGMEDELADAIIEECGPFASDATVASAIERRIAIPTRNVTEGCLRIALVGPTGVGKTTTAAKLAARYALTEKKRVALVTMDTYRIGAVEQLRTYARVMGLPLEVAESPEEMKAAMARHSDKDVVLIDTVGRSPRRSLQLAEINTFLNAARPTETHLVLSATFGAVYLAQSAEQFATLDTDRLIVTKLDEMPSWGVLPGLIRRTGLPLGFVTDGQEVPRNLRLADPAEIALHILGGSA